MELLHPVILNNMNNCIEIRVCRLCSSDKLETILDLGSTPPANSLVSAEDLNKKEESFPLVLVQCQDCGSCQIKHTVNPEILFKNYLYESSTSASFRKHFEDYAKRLVEFCGLKQGDLLIDIGSNDNILLKPVRELGITPLGIEPATNIVEKNKGDGIPVINTFFSPELACQTADKFGYAKVVTCNNCFAHIDDLHSVIQGAKILMTEDGYFVFEVAYLLDAFEKGLWDNQYHEHIFTHGVKSLRKLFAKHDMDMVHVERIATHGGSIRCFVKRAHGQWLNWGSTWDLIEQEEAIGLYNLAAWQQFRSKIETNKQAIIGTLTTLKNSGATIAAFGAPAKSTTLLNYLDIGTELIDFIVDDAVLKQGKYLPGKHIPIVSKAYLLEKNPTFCVLTAWNFADVIIKNNPEYKGTWVKIVPDVHVML